MEMGFASRHQSALLKKIICLAIALFKDQPKFKKGGGAEAAYLTKLLLSVMPGCSC